MFLLFNLRAVSSRIWFTLGGRGGSKKFPILKKKTIYFATILILL